jgi:hypothetical protein
MRVSAGPGDAAAAFRMFYESDVRHVLGTIRVPALVLSRGGEQAEEGAAFARLIPGARHETMPGAAFYVISEHADAYLEAIERFVVELRDEAVSIGARVTSLAGPSEVLVSQTVRDLVAGSELEFADRGEHELKGVPGRWRVYAVV